MTPQQWILLALNASIVVTVFGYGVHTTLDDVLYVVRRPAQLLRSLIAMFVLMPLLSFGIDWAFELRPEIEVVLIALALSPIPPLLPNKETKAGGSASYGLGLLVTVAVLSIVIVPFGLWLTGQVFHREMTAPGTVAWLILRTVILPLAVGMVLGGLLKDKAERMLKPVRLVANLLIAVIGVAIIALSWSSIAQLVGNGTLIALAVFVLVGLAVGQWLGGPLPRDRTVLALSTASRHPGIALAIATANHPDGKGITAAVLLYLLVSIVLSLPYVKWRQRGEPAPLR